MIGRKFPYHNIWPHQPPNLQMHKGIDTIAYGQAWILILKYMTMLLREHTKSLKEE